MSWVRVGLALRDSDATGGAGGVMLIVMTGEDFGF